MKNVLLIKFVEFMVFLFREYILRNIYTYIYLKKYKDRWIYLSIANNFDTQSSDICMNINSSSKVNRLIYYYIKIIVESK